MYQVESTQAQAQVVSQYFNQLLDQGERLQYSEVVNLLESY